MQLKYCPPSETKSHTEIHSLPKALHNPCDHNTDNAESRSLEHRVLPTRMHKTSCSNILESHKYPCCYSF